MENPFRSLRRNTTLSGGGASISCCSSVASNSVQFSYPYPRNHSTIMFVPSPLPNRISSTSVCSNNPLYDDDSSGNDNILYNFPYSSSNVSNNSNNNDENCRAQEGISVVSQYGFMTRRPRPPLNRAIPTIPESKSNESILSANVLHMKRLSMISSITNKPEFSHKDNSNDNALYSTEKEQKNALNDQNWDIVEGQENKNASSKKTSKLPKLKPKHRNKRQKKSPNSEHKEVKASVMYLPKSPLASVAYSVKSRLTKLSSQLSSRNRSSSPVDDDKQSNLVSIQMSKSLSASAMRSNDAKAQAERKISEKLKSSEAVSTKVSTLNDDLLLSEQGLLLDKSQEIPRRMPVTTLIPTPVRMCIKYMPQNSDKVVQHCVLKEPTFFNKNTHVSEHVQSLNMMNQDASEQAILMMVKMPELEVLPLNKENFKEKSNGANHPEKNFSQTIQKSLKIVEFNEYKESSLEKAQTKSDEFKFSETYAKTRLKKSPQSFPPLTSKRLSTDDDGVCHSRSVINITSHQHPENIKKSTRTHESRIDKPVVEELKRKVFLARSIRLVANKVCESPILQQKRKRNKSLRRNSDEDENLASHEEVFKRKGTRMRRAESQPADCRSKNFSLRAINSVCVKKSEIKHRKAPLAEFECMQINNSPAVEIMPDMPTNVVLKNKVATCRRSYIPRFITHLGSKKCGNQMKKRIKHDEQLPKEDSVIKLSSSRPTLAELLASPQVNRRDTPPAPDSHRSGLIDDEIGDQPMLISTADLPLIDELSCCSASPLSHRYHSHSHYSLSGAADSNTFNIANKFQKTHQETQISAARTFPPHPSSIFLVSVREKNFDNAAATGMESQMRNLQICGEEKDELPQSPLTVSSLKEGNKSLNFLNEKRTPLAFPCFNTTTIVQHKDVLETNKIEDVDLSSALPELLSDFKIQLCDLQDAIKRDHEEIEMLRLQNEYLRKQLTERDQIIESLQQQLRTASLLISPKIQQPLR